MHLKSVTLKGFKSFAQPTTFAFETGVTCIVGPNGSGKSNVVDALAWVMGEQGAKTLRGGKMEDVIFAGTATRGPLGRAEVQLTIDNSDGALPIEYAEVSISSTLFRNGASEYAINGDVCRLLDVQELLSDSGLGREMHVIVGQGRLDSVLQASPEDRRGFIEEAAGILKHRRRKEKTLRKLEAMEANLTRLSDLAGELRRQLKPLGPSGRDRPRGGDDRRGRARRQGAPARRRGRGAARRARDHARSEQERHTERLVLQDQLDNTRVRVEQLEAQQRSEVVDEARRVAFGLERCRSDCAGCTRLAGQRLALLGEAQRRRPRPRHHRVAGRRSTRPAPTSTRSPKASERLRMPRPRRPAKCSGHVPSSTRSTPTSPRRARSSRARHADHGASRFGRGRGIRPRRRARRGRPSAARPRCRARPPGGGRGDAGRSRPGPRSGRLGSRIRRGVRARPARRDRRRGEGRQRCASKLHAAEREVEALTAQTTALGRALEVKNAAAELVARGGAGIRGACSGDAVKITAGYEIGDRRGPRPARRGSARRHVASTLSRRRAPRATATSAWSTSRSPTRRSTRPAFPAIAGHRRPRAIVVSAPDGVLGILSHVVVADDLDAALSAGPALAASGDRRARSRSSRGRAKWSPSTPCAPDRARAGRVSSWRPNGMPRPSAAPRSGSSRTRCGKRFRPATARTGGGPSSHQVRAGDAARARRCPGGPHRAGEPRHRAATRPRSPSASGSQRESHRRRRPSRTPMARRARPSTSCRTPSRRPGRSSMLRRAKACSPSSKRRETARCAPGWMSRPSASGSGQAKRASSSSSGSASASVRPPPRRPGAPSSAVRNARSRASVAAAAAGGAGFDRPLGVAGARRARIRRVRSHRRHRRTRGAAASGI